MCFQFGGRAMAEQTSEVAVVDINMPFGSMVAFMVKWAIASIPAMLIVFIIFLGFAVILEMLGGLVPLG